MSEKRGLTKTFRWRSFILLVIPRNFFVLGSLYSKFTGFLVKLWLILFIYSYYQLKNISREYHGVLGKNNSNKMLKDQAAKEMFKKTKQKVVYNLSVCVLNPLLEVSTLLSLVAINFVEWTYKFFKLSRDLALVKGGILLCLVPTLPYKNLTPPPCHKSVLLSFIQVPYKSVVLSIITCGHLSLIYHTQK